MTFNSTIKELIQPSPWREHGKFPYRIISLPLHILKPHEEIINDHVEELTKEIVYDHCIYRPILVDKNSLVILDGHHRFQAAHKIGLKSMPCVLVNYGDQNLITLKFWRKNVSLTKQQVVQAGIAGKILPPKTTRHILHIEHTWKSTSLSVLQ